MGGLPRWLSGKESACQCRRCRDMGSIPGSRKSPGGGNGNPCQYSCLENPLDRRAWQATVHGITKSWTCFSDYACTHMSNIGRTLDLIYICVFWSVIIKTSIFLNSWWFIFMCETCNQHTSWSWCEQMDVEVVGVNSGTEFPYAL